METHNNKCCCHDYNGHFSSVIQCKCVRKIPVRPEINPNNNIYYNVCNKNRWQKDKSYEIKSNPIEKKKKCCS